ncbi:hypothetical protein AAC387_Pa06g2332 [Persea americana]
MAQDGQQFSDGARNTPRLSATSSKTLLPRETSTVENPGKAPSRFWFLEQLQLLRKHFDSLPQPQGQSQTDSPAPQIQKSYVPPIAADFVETYAVPNHRRPSKSGSSRSHEVSFAPLPWLALDLKLSVDLVEDEDKQGTLEASLLEGKWGCGAGLGDEHLQLVPLIHEFLGDAEILGEVLGRSSPLRLIGGFCHTS